MAHGFGETEAAILVGGLGTRLRSVLPDAPKALAPVLGRPMLAHVLDMLEAGGIRRAILCTGYMGDQVAEAFGRRHGGVDLVYSREHEPLGTGGAVSNALPLVQAPELLVLNGDSFCEFSLPVLLAWHRARRATGTILLTEVDDTARYGTVHADDEGRITAFAEKDPGRNGPGWINAGVYLFDSGELRGRLPSGRSSLERDVFPALVGKGLFAYRGGGRFIDIGTPESLQAAMEFFAQPSDPARPRRSFAVALDRDGTVNMERHYLARPDELELIPGAAAGLRKLRTVASHLFVVTNQSAIGRGKLDETTLQSIHHRLRDMLAREGVEIDGFYHCPHLPTDACECRKPNPGMLHQAARALRIDLSTLIVIGDKACDVNLAHGVGVPSILVLTGHGAAEFSDADVRPTYVTADLAAAAEVVAGLARRSVAAA